MTNPVQSPSPRAMRVLLIVALVFSSVSVAGPGLSGCNARSAIFESMANGFARKFGVREIRAPELIKRLAAGSPTLLIDVREPAEQSVSILAGAIRITPRDNPAEMKQYRDFRAKYGGGKAADGTGPLIVVYCAGGYRSAEAITRIPPDHRVSAARAGIPILNLHGGIIAYANAGGPLIEPESGQRINMIHGYNSYWSTFVQAPARAVLKPPLKQGK